MAINEEEAINNHQKQQNRKLEALVVSIEDRIINIVELENQKKVMEQAEIILSLCEVARDQLR